MIYEPRVLFNPKSEPVEFMCGGQSFVFKPGEKKMLEPEVANHALKMVNTGLKVYEEGDDAFTEGIAYDKLPWKELISMASERGIFKTGMDRNTILMILKEEDERA